MINRKLLWKKLTSKIIFPVVVGLIITAITFGVNKVWGASTPGEEEIKIGVLTTLSQYERDVNMHDFEAHRYFSSNVTTFFDMYSTGPEKINTFWRQNFDKAFRDMRISFDRSTIQVHASDAEGYNVSIIMVSSYYHIKNKKQVSNEYSRYDLRFDENFKIFSLKQSFEKK